MQLYYKNKATNRFTEFESLDDLSPNTITALINYNGNINLTNVFLTLVTQLLPCDSSFIITFVRYMRETRGMGMKDKLEENDYFKKSVTISIIHRGDNVSIKLAEKTFHICGVKSLEEAKEIVLILIEKIKEAQKFIEFIKKGKQGAAEKGKKAFTDFVAETIQQKCKLRNSQIDIPFTIKKLTPEENMYFERIKQYSNYMTNIDMYLTHLSRVLSIEDDVIVDEPEILDVSPIMRNYIYSLCTLINRWSLACLMDNVSGVVVKYDNCTQHSVRIKIPFTDDEMKEEIEKKKKKKRYHHFSIYKTGTISQSGKVYEMMKEHFNMIIDILRVNYKIITDMDMSYMLEQMSDDESDEE